MAFNHMAVGSNPTAGDFYGPELRGYLLNIIQHSVVEYFLSSQQNKTIFVPLAQLVRAPCL